MKKIIVLTLTVLLSACASMTKVTKQDVALSQVKKVAIIGFSVTYIEPEKSKFAQLVDTAKVLTGNDDKPQYGENTDVGILYQDFVAKIQKETPWQVLPTAQMASNASYKKIYKSGTEGLQIRPPITKDATVLRPTQILDAGAFVMMKPEQKAQIVKDLGVDAVMIVSIISSMETEGGLKKYIGMAEYRPRAQVNIEMIDAQSQKPVWQDSWAWGKGDKAVQSTLNIADNKELMEQVKIAVRYGFDDLLGRYKQ